VGTQGLLPCHPLYHCSGEDSRALNVPRSTPFFLAARLTPHQRFLPLHGMPRALRSLFLRAPRAKASCTDGEAFFVPTT